MANDYSQLHRFGRKIAIFDLDGCLSDDRWRLHLIAPEGTEHRFRMYHEHLGADDVIKHNMDILRERCMQNQGSIFVTARPDSVRGKTLDWLAKNGLHIPSHCLFMRDDGEEGVGSVALKGSILSKIRSRLIGNQLIMDAYDDRPDILKMYANAGIPNVYLATHINCHRVESQADIDGMLARQAMIAAEYGRKLPQEAQCTAEGPKDEPAEPAKAPTWPGVADSLQEALNTFKERNATYGDNAKKVGEIMAVLFPDGITIKSPEDHKLFLQMYLIVTKLTRFVNSGMTHQDSIHDMIVYAALVESAAAHRINAKEKK